MSDANAAELLAKLKAQRGYLMAFHEMWARHEPGIVEPYNTFYDFLAFDAKDMSVPRRELIWISALAAAQEDRGRLHINRAIGAGVPDAEMLAAVALSTAPDLHNAFAFAKRAWQIEQSDAQTVPEYAAAFAALAGPLDTVTAHLAAGAAMAVRRNEDGCMYHFAQALHHGASARQIVEAASITFLPAGAPALMLAGDVVVKLLDQASTPSHGDS